LFLLDEPSEGKILDFLQSQRGAPFSYTEVGATQEGAKRRGGYAVDFNRARLGYPLARRLQRRFARDSIGARVRAVGCEAPRWGRSSLSWRAPGTGVLLC
jgi:hypothetical protein